MNLHVRLDQHYQSVFFPDGGSPHSARTTGILESTMRHIISQPERSTAQVCTSPCKQGVWPLPVRPGEWAREACWTVVVPIASEPTTRSAAATDGATDCDDMTFTMFPTLFPLLGSPVHPPPQPSPPLSLLTTELRSDVINRVTVGKSQSLINREWGRDRQWLMKMEKFSRAFLDNQDELSLQSSR
jgi:hypothetical protein